ncbi:TrmB family transcriptional regulator [Natrialbaceae archaeon AArc-T1-2]|uniref:TrmB family transcriptional regulator n=1 Tax=Natrialbaceae archaeon AArc-T1-2 TaxID=3053904 RepID=UPI00255A7B59|nr:helix-turn-helix domain-containing protein [Natrialbaceae archaeon AArc-T1-2]WIV67668.1 helix-turn-helix domain-containing protein [Natrialbaceae archaeon AArc-T1-2]
MTAYSARDTAIELLQQLGLKEYEARSFVALSQLPTGTAKEISDVSDVPRTRVYDAVRALETKGLVEVQHSNPQQFRSVAAAEAIETLRQEYESRLEELRDALQQVDAVNADDDADGVQEVWSLSGETAISTRTEQLLEAADREVVLAIGSERVLSADLLETLGSLDELTVIAAAPTDDLCDRLQAAAPDTEVFVSELEWLAPSPDDPNASVAIGRILMVDRDRILVSSLADDGNGIGERAVSGRGIGNGLVVVVRQLIATELLQSG